MCELIDIFVKKFYSPSLMDINELDEIMQITTRQFLVAEIEMPHLISKFLQEGSERPEGNRTEATVRIIIK